MDSIWIATAVNSDFPALQRELSVDVTIVGGGITGLTAAMLLTESGKKVAVLEAAEVGSGTTGNSTGNLYSLLSSRLHTIRQKWDERTMAAVAASRASAIDLIEDTTRKRQLDGGFHRRAWHFYTVSGASSQDDEQITNEYEAARIAGLNVKWTQSLPLPFGISKALRIENQAQFHPLNYVRGLAHSISSDRCQIFEHSKAIEIDEANCVVKTERGQIESDKIILATHTPKGFNLVQAQMEVYREYGIAGRLIDDNYPEGIFWGLGRMRHSIRSLDVHPEKYLIVVGGEHKTGNEEDTRRYYDELEQFTRSHFKIGSIHSKWSAQQYRPADKLPYIGKTAGSPNVYIATGFSSDGLTYGAVAAMIITDQILGRENSWTEFYSPTRFTPVKSAKGFLAENVNVAKHFAKDYLTDAHIKPLDAIAPGEGALVKIGGEKVALYRDENYGPIALSPVCPHLKCIVHWNNAEKTWDCPCHGSRFRADGSVIEGPAIAALERKAIPAGAIDESWKIRVPRGKDEPQ
jgi:glycine/D-amino acid oxidase-like deaminating enzyme/nitrite reductase/ring-hydroxylating ferredoxin subunit